MLLNRYTFSNDDKTDIAVDTGFFCYNIPYIEFII